MASRSVILSFLEKSNSMSLSRIALPICIGLIVTIAAQIIYNIWFHPLRRFPGPWLQAAFAWPSFWSTLVGVQVFEETQLHDKYGPVVRIAPNSLSFTGQHAWRDIYGFQPGKKQLQKDPGFYLVQPRHETQDIIAANDEDHSRIRRLLSHAFSDSALQDQENLVLSHVDLFINQLKDRAMFPVDIMSWYNYLTFDIIGDLAFGEAFGALKTGTEHEFVRTIFRGFKSTRFIRVARNYPLLRVLLRVVSKLFPAIGQSRRTIMDFSAQKVRARIANNVDRKDFTTYLLRHNDERGMSMAEMERNANVLVIAGSETTATLLSGLTYYLACNQHVWSKLAAEIRDSFQSEVDMTSKALASLPYLNATLEEGLWLYPPVPFRLQRVTGAEGCVIDGYKVSPGTSVGVLQYAASRSRSNWHQPEEFIPERWLEQRPVEFRSDVRSTFQPFSTGPRNCIGKNLAYMEMRLILAKLVWHFDVALNNKSSQWLDQKIFFFWDKPSLWIDLIQRS